MNDVSASNTKDGFGMLLADWDTVILNKIVANGNKGVKDGFGVYASFNSMDSSRTLILKGKNSFDNNDGYGLFIEGPPSSSSRATVLVDGKVTANDNDDGSGIFAASADFEIKKGSLEACGNGITDITSQSSTFSGKKYICDYTDGTEAEVPVCKPCRDGKARKLGVSN